MEKQVSHVKNVKKELVEKAENVTIQWLIGEEVNTPCYLRLFTFDVDGRMPLHKHENFEHIQYYLKGKMKVKIGGDEYKLGKDDFLFIPEKVSHTYENIGDSEAQFLCIIPAIKNRETELLEE